MRSGKKAAEAKAVLFKRLYGVKPGIFGKMLPILRRNTMPCTKKAAKRRN
jgi:hypothetical protein